MKTASNLLFVFLLFAISSCNSGKKDYHPDTSTYKSPLGTEVYKPDSATIAGNYEIPEWFKDSKFGVFIHWGVYSVPAFGNEWYPRNMYQSGSETYKHHIATYGDLSEFGYKDFIPMFKAEKFNADEWVALFKESGIKYVVPVAEHHDGFSMYNSVGNKWNSVNMGPKKDIVGELKKATVKHGLHFGLSSHRAENAWFYNGGALIPSDVQDPAFSSLYGQLLEEPGGHTLDCPEGAGFNDESREKWLAHTYELIDMYQPELMWFDWTVGKYPFQPTFYKFLAYYYNNAVDWNKGVVVNTKTGYGSNIQVFDIERGKSGKIREFPWQTDTSIGKKSWGYIDGEENKTPNQIIDDLVDIVAKNGNLLLNIGPLPDGTIAKDQEDVLLEIGRWLKVNGEAIYGTRPWIKAAEGTGLSTSGAFSDNIESEYTAQDIRFTTKQDVLYAISLGWTNGDITVQSVDQSFKVNHVSMLGSNEELIWSQTTAGLKINFPKQKPSEYAHSLKIEFQKSKAGQIYQWSEDEGNEFLSHTRQSITTPEAWKTRAKEIRTHILHGAGLDPLPEKCPLNPIFGGKRKFDGYQVQNVAFESLPGVYVTGSLYSPIEVKGTPPGILSPHGHWPNREDYGRYRPDVQKRCAVMARMGAIVFSYDMVGYGQLADFGWKHKHSETMKLQIWNGIRAVDFLLSMGVNPETIACTGASGGGTQTFHIAAVDPRIFVSVPVVMVSNRHFGGCICELGMPIHKTDNFKTNNVEIAACNAPKPLLLVSVGTDATETTPEIEYPFIKYIYGLFDKSELVENAHLPDDQHGYDYNKRAAVYPFMAKHLNLDLSRAVNQDGTLNEDEIVIEEIEDLYTFDENHPYPDNAIRNNNDIVWN